MTDLRTTVQRGRVPGGHAYSRTLLAEARGHVILEQWVIHGAVMGQDLRTNAALVSQTTTSVLQVADELGAESLALPAFGTGVGGFPLDECARLMVDAVRAHEPRTLRRVVFAVYGEEARRAFEGALAKA